MRQQPPLTNKMRYLTPPASSPQNKLSFEFDSSLKTTT